jgi:hypothetical protein
MELIKKSERKTKIQDAFNTWKQLGATFENEGRYMKWKEVSNGRMAVKFDIYKVRVVNKNFNLDSTFYVFSDTLDRMALSDDKVDWGEICTWLKEHGYKTEKDFYIQDQGMSEEAYEEWCNA